MGLRLFVRGGRERDRRPVQSPHHSWLGPRQPPRRGPLALLRSSDLPTIVGAQSPSGGRHRVLSFLRTLYLSWRDGGAEKGRVVVGAAASPPPARGSILHYWTIMLVPGGQTHAPTSQRVYTLARNLAKPYPRRGSPSTIGPGPNAFPAFLKIRPKRCKYHSFA